MFRYYRDKESNECFDDHIIEKHAAIIWLKNIFLSRETPKINDCGHIIMYISIMNENILKTYYFR